MSNNLPFTLTESKQLKGTITKLFESAKKLETRVQNVTLSALYHMAMHGDSVHVTRLLAEFPKGSRVDRWAAWVQRFMPVTVNLDAGKVTVKKFIKDPNEDGGQRDVRDADWQWAEAAKSPWTDEKTGKENPPASVAQLVTKIAKLGDADSKLKRTESLTEFAVELAKLDGFKALCEKWVAIEKAHAEAEAEAPRTVSDEQAEAENAEAEAA